MTSSLTSRLSSRKQPRQERSARLVSDILEGAAHVLTRDGAHRFTTARVAERAGVSVGSLYQYFPNKEAILFRLQTDEWKQTSGLIQGILADRTVPPFDRLRRAVRTFFQTEVAEAALRTALDDAAPLYRDAPEARAHLKSGTRQVSAFMREVLPGASRQDRAFAAEIMLASASAVGKKVSEDGRPPSEVNGVAAAMADMFCAYFERLNGRIVRRLEAETVSD
jgi:AcrR family transcriptional regulator